MKTTSLILILAIIGMTQASYNNVSLVNTSKTINFGGKIIS